MNYSMNGQLLQVTAKPLTQEELYDIIDDFYDGGDINGLDELCCDSNYEIDELDDSGMVLVDIDESDVDKLLSMDINDIPDELLEKYIIYVEESKQVVKEIKKMECMNCGIVDDIVDDIDVGIKVCYMCGAIVTILFDHSLETNSYDGETNNKRCNAASNYFLPQSSLAVNISGNNAILKARHAWSSMPYHEKSLNNEFKKIHACCMKGNILKCVEDDAKIAFFNIKKIKLENGKSKIIRGINRKRLRAGCIFKACQKNNCTKGLNDIAKITGISKKDVTKGCKMVEGYMQKTLLPYKAITTTPEQYIPNFCKILKYKELIKDCISISNNISRLNIASGHTPMAIACASIMLVCNMKNIQIDKKTLSVNFDISEITLTKTYKNLLRFKNLVNDNCKTDNALRIIEDYRKNAILSEELQLKLLNIKKSIVYHIKLDHTNVNQINPNIEKTHNDVNSTVNDIELLYSFPTIKAYGELLLEINKKIKSNIEKSLHI